VGWGHGLDRAGSG